MRSLQRLNFKTFAMWHNLKNKRVIGHHTGPCSLDEDLEIYILVGEYNLSSGYRSCRNGLGLQALLFVSVAYPYVVLLLMKNVDAPTIFRMAGFGSEKSQWISGLNNVFYMVSLHCLRFKTVQS